MCVIETTASRKIWGFDSNKKWGTKKETALVLACEAPFLRRGQRYTPSKVELEKRMWKRHKLVTAGTIPQGCGVDIWQVSKNQLENTSLYSREWAIWESPHVHVLCHTHTHTNACVRTCLGALELMWRGSSNKHMGQTCGAKAFVAFVSQIWPRQRPNESHCCACQAARGAEVSLSEVSHQTFSFHPFFPHGKDWSPEGVNAFEFEQGVEVSPKLPGPC